MKVLHIATFDSGGAGIAALRLHRALLAQGVESRFLCMYSKSRGVPEHYIQPPEPAPLLYRVLNKLGFSMTPNQRYWKRIRKLEGQFELATLPFHDLDMSEHPQVRWADVINLHFISFFIDIPSFFSKVNKPFVWTLHDMFPFLGCFHYQLDVENNRKTFGEIENELAAVKREAYAGHPEMAIVTPSAWLGEISKRSAAFSEHRHQHIRNSVDTKIFQPGDRTALRRKYDLKEDGKVLLFVSEHIENKRKGFDLLLDALKMLDTSGVVLLSIGRPSGSLQDLPYHRSMGVIDQPDKMAELYGLADLFILPSREDNLPNTMLESLCCGTPVVAFRTGGMADEIEHGVNGLLAASVDAERLAESIDRGLNELNFDRNAIRREAESRYGMAVQANAYKSLYNTLLS